MINSNNVFTPKPSGGIKQAFAMQERAIPQSDLEKFLCVINSVKNDPKKMEQLIQQLDPETATLLLRLHLG